MVEFQATWERLNVVQTQADQPVQNIVNYRYINGLLKDDWSPEPIAGRLKLKDKISLHHETIYHYLLRNKANAGLLYKLLRHQGKCYRKRYGCANN